MTDTKAVSRSERAALRNVTRTHFKVLRSELDASEADLVAELNRVLAERERDRSEGMREVKEKLDAVTNQANALLREVLDGFDEKFAEGSWGRPQNFYAPHVYRRDREDVDATRKAARAGIKARIQRAKVAIARQEADLLRELAIDGLEEEQAHAYVRALPTASAVLGTDIVRELVG